MDQQFFNFTRGPGAAALRGAVTEASAFLGSLANRLEAGVSFTELDSNFVNNASQTLSQVLDTLLREPQTWFISTLLYQHDAFLFGELIPAYAVVLRQLQRRSSLESSSDLHGLRKSCEGIFSRVLNLDKVGPSDWAIPSFVAVKKDAFSVALLKTDTLNVWAQTLLAYRDALQARDDLGNLRRRLTVAMTDLHSALCLSRDLVRANKPATAARALASSHLLEHACALRVSVAECTGLVLRQEEGEWAGQQMSEQSLASWGVELGLVAPSFDQGTDLLLLGLLAKGSSPFQVLGLGSNPMEVRHQITIASSGAVVSAPPQPRTQPQLATAGALSAALSHPAVQFYLGWLLVAPLALAGQPPGAGARGLSATLLAACPFRRRIGQLQTQLLGRLLETAPQPLLQALCKGCTASTACPPTSSPAPDPDGSTPAADPASPSAGPSSSLSRSAPSAALTPSPGGPSAPLPQPAGAAAAPGPEPADHDAALQQAGAGRAGEQPDAGKIQLNNNQPLYGPRHVYELLQPLAEHCLELCEAGWPMELFFCSRACYAAMWGLVEPLLLMRPAAAARRLEPAWRLLIRTDVMNRSIDTFPLDRTLEMLRLAGLLLGLLQLRRPLGTAAATAVAAAAGGGAGTAVAAGETAEAEVRDPAVPADAAPEGLQERKRGAHAEPAPSPASACGLGAPAVEQQSGPCGTALDVRGGDGGAGRVSAVPGSAVGGAGGEVGGATSSGASPGAEHTGRSGGQEAPGDSSEPQSQPQPEQAGQQQLQREGEAMAGRREEQQQQQQPAGGQQQQAPQGHFQPQPSPPAYAVAAALSCGLLPWVEGFLRTTWPSSDNCGRLPFLEIMVKAVDLALRRPGCLPALLAHGEERQAAALVVTLGKVTRLDPLSHLDSITRQMMTHHCDPRAAWRLQLLAMMEQLAAALLGGAQEGTDGRLADATDLPVNRGLSGVQEEGSSAGSGSAGAGPSGRDASGAADGFLPPGTLPLPQPPPPLPVGPSWEQVVRSGGCPAAGTAARAQLERMAAVAAAEWLPPLLKRSQGLEGSFTPNIGRRFPWLTWAQPLSELIPHGGYLELWRWLLHLARQGSRRTEEPSGRPEEGSGAVPVPRQGASGAGNDDGGPAPPQGDGADPAAAWLRLLVDRTAVLDHIRIVLRLACLCGRQAQQQEMPEQEKPKSARGRRQRPSTDATVEFAQSLLNDWVQQECDSAATAAALQVLPAALTVLQVLAEAAPGDVRQALQENLQAREELAAWVRNLDVGWKLESLRPFAGWKYDHTVLVGLLEQPGWGPGLPLDGHVRALLEREGRQGLLRRLEELAGRAEGRTTAAAVKEAEGGSGVGDTEGRPAQSQEGLLGASGSGGGGREVDSWPLLPAEPLLSPGWLFPRCAFAGCTGLQGGSEAGVRLKACGRCRAVAYCCPECQRADWAAGHRGRCAPRAG